MSVIDKPGFYLSKAGKCEVVEVRGNYAIGWQPNGVAGAWFCDEGRHFRESFYDITGPWVGDDRNAEAERIVFNLTARLCKHNITEDCGCDMAVRACLDNYARLVHLREVEDPKQ